MTSPARNGVPAWLARHWFLLGLGAAAGLAFLLPELGARGGPLRPEITTRLGVAAIFFIQGLVIAPAALAAGALRWRLHLAVQLFVFLLFPLFLLLLDTLGGRLLLPDLRLGFLFLAVLPTTVSTCVVFTAAAGGNTTGALFNAALANLLGVLVTPLWAALLLSARGGAPPLGPMMGEVALLLLAPLVLGQVVRPLLRRFHAPDPRRLAIVSSCIILYIVFAAFAGSVTTGAFVRSGAAATASVALIALGIFVAATAAAALLGRRLGFDRPDRVALLFCAPQKTLAAGVPMAQILFAGHPGLGLLLLPVIVYHAIQLLAGAFVIQRAGRAHRAGTPPAG